MEDKLVQRAVVMILEQIYEVDFLRLLVWLPSQTSCHEALAVLGGIISTRKVNWISDADIKGFFDNVCARASDLDLLRQTHQRPEDCSD